MPQQHNQNLLKMTARLVAAYVSHSKIASDDVPALILRVHNFLKNMPARDLKDLLEKTQHPATLQGRRFVNIKNEPIPDALSELLSLIDDGHLHLTIPDTIHPDSDTSCEDSDN